MPILCTKINKLLNKVHDLNTKINLFTLTIRDEEMEKQYAKARNQYYWETIIVVEFLREVTMTMVINAGFFKERSFEGNYLARAILYIILAISYIASKKNPQG